MKKVLKPIGLPNLGKKDIIPDKIKFLQNQKKRAQGQPEIVRRLSDPNSPEKKQIKKNATEMKGVKDARSSLVEWNKVVHGHIAEKLPLLKLETVKLPTIEAVFLIMQEHQNKLNRAFLNHRWSEVPEIEATTKRQLEEIGLAPYIDFTPDEDKKELNAKLEKLAK